MNLKRLGRNSERMGLMINFDKMNVLRLNTSRQDPLKINGTDVRDTDSWYPVTFSPMVTLLKVRSLHIVVKLLHKKVRSLHKIARSKLML